MNSKSSTFLRRLVYGVVFGILVYAVIALSADSTDLREGFQKVPLYVIAGACGLSALNYVLRFVKWHAYLRLLKLKVPPKQSVLIFGAGLLMAISPAKIGEVIKSILLKRSCGISVARSAPIVFAERLTDLLGLFVLAAMGIVVFSYGVVAFALILAALFVAIAVLQSPAVVAAILDLIDRIPYLRRFGDAFERAYSSTRILLQWRPLVAATALSAVGWAMEALAFGWILAHLGASVPVLFEAFFVFSTATLVGALSFLPGGLAVTEASMTGLVMWLELFEDIAPALVATYLIRFTTLWFGVIVGLLAFLLYEWNQRHRDQRPPPAGTPIGGDDTVPQRCSDE